LQTLAQDRDLDVRFSAETELERRTGVAKPMPPRPVQQALL
jgi:hypothetical protein